MSQKPDDQQRRKNLESIRGVLIRLETMADANAAAVEAHASAVHAAPEARASATVTPLHPPARPEPKADAMQLPQLRGQEPDATAQAASRNPDKLDRFAQFDAGTYGRQGAAQSEWTLNSDRRPAPGQSPAAPGTARKNGMLLIAGIAVSCAFGAVALLYVAGIIHFRGSDGSTASTPPAVRNVASAETLVKPAAAAGRTEPAAPTASLEPQPAPSPPPPAPTPEAAAQPAPAPSLTAPAPVPAPRPVARPAVEVAEQPPAPAPSAPEVNAEIPVDIRIDPRLVERSRDHYVTINGLPQGARPSSGRMVFPGSFAVEAADLPGLKIILPPGSPAVVDINLVLVARPGSVLAETTARIGAKVTEPAVELSSVRNPRQTVTLALQQIEQGNLAGARDLLMQAVDAGDQTAALILGTSYDPRFSFQFGHQDAGDIAAAMRWYRVAAERGSAEASERLRYLESQPR